MKYKKYPSYKDSGIAWLGEIPEHWNISSLKSLLQERKESNKPIKTKNILSLDMYRGVIPYSEKGTGGNKAKDDLTAYKLAYPGDIVLNSMNVIAGSVGLSKYFGAVSPVYYMLRPRKDYDTVEYFNDIFQSESFQKSLYGLGNGIMVKESSTSGKLNTIRMRIPMDKLNTVELPYPNNKEQQQISTFLDKATSKIDTLIEKQTKLIELLKEKRQAVISHAITKGINPNVKMKDSGVEWLGEIPEHWEVKKLKYVSTVNNQSLSEKYNEDFEINYIDIGSVTTGYIEKSEKMEYSESPSRARRIIKEGDILVSTVRTYLKAIAPVTKNEHNYIASTGFAVISPVENIVSSFLKYSLLSNYFVDLVEAESVGISYPAINSSDLIQFNITFPTIKEQKHIAEYLDEKTAKIDKLVGKANKSIELLKEKRAALISAAVTGKIDVREVS